MGGYSRCHAYCGSFRNYCNKTLEFSDCLDQCLTFPVGDVDLGVLSGNTIQCREYHLGIVAETRGCMIEETKRWNGQGGDVASFPDANSTANCSSLCLDEELCEFWVFRTDTGVCSLKKNYQSTSINQATSVSGNKCIDHCAHAAYDGGGVCASPPEPDTGSALKTVSGAWVTFLVLLMSTFC